MLIRAALVFPGRIWGRQKNPKNPARTLDLRILPLFLLQSKINAWLQQEVK